MSGRIEKQYGILEDILAEVVEPRDLPLALLEEITDDFSEDRKIGEGGFGTVYKGVLGNKNVAVKKIVVNEYTVDERLFRREVDSLMRMKNHPNLVRFLGFCSNKARIVKQQTISNELLYPQIMDILLCFEFISNESLDKHITDELRGLTWDTRFDIIRGICEGLRYLHEDKSIIHLDLKPANILLDDHMIPKIADFGQARLAENTHTKGERFFTPGYCAPEYWAYGQTSYMADIYSLGVVIVELVTGTKHIPDITHVLRRWTHRWNKSASQHQHHQVIKCMEIAVRCSLQEPKDRPSITDVILDLSKIGSSSGLIGQTSLCHYDDMLGIEPLELRFSSEHISCSAELTNKTPYSIAFNIQVPSRQYIAQPDRGIVLPGFKRDVKITVQSQESATQVMNVDKFVVQSIKLKEDLADEEITEHMFNSKGSEAIDEVNLMVIYEPNKYQVDQSLDLQEKEVSKDIGSSSYNNTRRSFTPPQFLPFDPVKSISRNQARSLPSDQTINLATGAVGSLVHKLSQLLKYNLETYIRSDLDCVIEELRDMHTDLSNVSEVQRDNNNEQINSVKLWADEVRELSYDIEDDIDDFLMQIKVSKQATGARGMVGLIEKIGGAIKDIKNQVQHLSGWKGKYKLKEINANTVSTINAHHLSALFKDCEKIIGIDYAVEDFTKRLRGGDDNGYPIIKLLWNPCGKELKVHSIFGGGGLGKTTLARAVYKQLQKSFSLMAFVPVGRNPNVKKFFCDILFELDKPRFIRLNPENMDERQLINELREVLENKRYLIVIDDLWDKKVWCDSIRFAFVDDKCGSKIIITTRILEVATVANDVYKLEPLSPGYSEELFYSTLSPEEGRCQYAVASEVINKILVKCGGLPLAIITIASLLGSKQRDDWPKVYNSIGFGHEGNEDTDNTRKILLFSYSDLPCHLRTCLLHLSIFPEDKLVPKDMAIWMWVAEGFVHEKPGKGLFELGEGYFNQLVSRSLIQLVVLSPSLICFRIHDLVLDMICSLSKDENFVTVLETDEQHTSFKNNARRLAVQKRGIEKLDPPTSNCMVQLRSFYATGCLMPPLSKFKVLRVLSLDGCRFNEDQPYQLEHIGKLLQLRYLGLENMAIRKLPGEIGDLLHLQTLILTGTDRLKLPHSLGLLRQLKCLRATNIEVPDWLVNMTSLEYLSLTRFGSLQLAFAKGLSKLKELRDLKIDGCSFRFSPSLNEEGDLVKSIGNLLNLQRLEISCYSRHPEISGEKIWEGFVPPKHLHSLNLWVRVSFPHWMNSTYLPRLSYLDVNLRYLEARCLEILGRLPELHTLKLRSEVGSWLTVTGSGAFPKLRHFCSDNDKVLKFQRGVMPWLEYLELKVNVRYLHANKFDCDFTSLRNLPSLWKVRLELQVSAWGEGSNPEYVKRMEAAVKHAIDTHPLRRPVLEVLKLY